MSGHSRHSRRLRGSHEREEFSQRGIASNGGHAASRKWRPLSWIGVIVGLSVWSLLTWLGYALVDPVLGWVATSAGLVLDSGKDLATATGAGKEVGVVVDGLKTSGIPGQGIALLQVVLKPAIILIWAIGALALIVAPAILPKIGTLLAALPH